MIEEIFKVIKGNEALNLDNVNEHYGFGFPFEWEDEVNRFCKELNRSFTKYEKKIMEQEKIIYQLREQLRISKEMMERKYWQDESEI